MSSDDQTTSNDEHAETITSAHVPDLEEVRAWMKKMIASLRFVDLVAAIIALIMRMAAVNAELVKQLAKAREKRPRSETLARLQRQLSFAFASRTKRKLDREPDSHEPKDPDEKKKKRRGGGRTTFPSHLERVDVSNPVPPELRICPLCGTEMCTVAHDVCETLDVIPARVVVVRREDETVACPHDDTIVSAPKPPQVVERGTLGTTLLVEALADKYIEHLPIERQCQRWEHAGVDIAPQTLGRGVAATIDVLQPVAQCIAERTREPGLLATDASGIPVLDRQAADGIRTGTIWCWINERWVTFVYSPRGDANSVRVFLGDVLRRSVQCDGTSITSFLERAGGQRPGCWSHGRRRLVVAAKGGDLTALEGLRMIGRLFVVERASTREGDTPEQRKERRAKYSKPIVSEIRAWVDEQRRTIPPKTPLGKALGYLARQWQRLCLFLEDGRIPLTNNRVERELRKLVLGKKNWLFTWEDLGGERTASILTIIATCVTHGIKPRAYLHLVTRLLINGWPQSRLRDLLPDRIQLDHPELRVRTHPRPRAADELPRLPSPGG